MPVKKAGCEHYHYPMGTYSLATTWLPSSNRQEKPSQADGEHGSPPFHDLSISCPGFLCHSSSLSRFATSTAQQGQQESPYQVRKKGIRFGSEQQN